jgi:membrane protease YdiL (CAAX protease family)
VGTAAAGDAFGRAQVATYPDAVPDADQTVTAPEHGVPVRWGMGDAAVGWLVGLLGGAIAYSVVVAASGTDADDLDSLPLGWVAVAQLGLWVGLLGAPYLAARFKGNGMRQDFGLTARLHDLWVGAWWGFVGQFAIIWIVYLPLQWLTDVSSEEFAEPAQEMADKATGAVGVVLLVLIVGIGAPIVEEIFYRGLVQRSLIRRFGPGWGIAGASVLFGAAHLQLLQFPALTLAGALFGVLAYRADRLGPAIVAHVMFNMAAVVTLLVGS